MTNTDQTTPNTSETHASTVPVADGTQAAAKKPRKRGWIVAGVIAAVIIVAGAGFGYGMSSRASATPFATAPWTTT